MLKWMMGIKGIEKIRKEEIRARAGLANLGEKIREVRLMVRPCERVKDKGRCSDDNMDDRNEWTQKDRKTKTEVERCHTKRYEGEKKHNNGKHRPLSRRLDRCNHMIQNESRDSNGGNCICFQRRRVRHNANFVPYAQIPACPL